MRKAGTKKLFVYGLLKRRIIAGELTAGTILNESDLAQELKIGKTPTREALIMLVHDGFVDALPRVGYVVTRLTLQDVFEIFTLRIIIEVEAIGIAVERITETDIGKLIENNRQESALAQEKDGASLREQGYQLNREFHLVIAQAAGNNRLTRLIQNMIDDLERALTFDPYLADPSQHNDIILHLKNRDKSKAQDAMRRHIEETRTRIVNRF
ncbi:MAG: GntR family transcriptional regulator [Anaerolineales bacterium]|nr:GntR family transcriptional regulator [Anaerolineales bacterium]